MHKSVMTTIVIKNTEDFMQNTNKLKKFETAEHCTMKNSTPASQGYKHGEYGYQIYKNPWPCCLSQDVVSRLAGGAPRRPDFHRRITWPAFPALLVLFMYLESLLLGSKILLK